MGKSLPPPAAINLVDSFARRRGSDVEIVLSDPKTTVSPAAEARLRNGRKSATFTVSAEHEGRLVLRGARSSLTDGTWTIRLHDGDDVSPVDARLLVQGERPLVLLWGATGQQTKFPDVARKNAKQKTAAALGRGLDRVLGTLPPERAAQVRARIRRTARRVLK
jgi:hypothetical protein